MKMKMGEGVSPGGGSRGAQCLLLQEAALGVSE